MKRNQRFKLKGIDLREIVALRLALGTVATITLGNAASAQLPPTDNAPSSRTPDFGKHYVERPVKRLFKTGSAPQERQFDGSKLTIERPVKKLFKTESDPPNYYRDLSKRGIEGPVKTMMRFGSSSDTLNGSVSGVATSVSPPGGQPATTMVTLAVTGKLTDSSPMTKQPPLPSNAQSIANRVSTNSIQYSESKVSHTVAASDKTSTGLVLWHKDMKEAMRHSAKSGKPLLVFHMMGMLDDRFC